MPRIAAEEAHEERKAKWRPRCSSAGVEKCVRAEVYKALGVTPAPLPGRTVQIFEDGVWHEEMSLDRIRKSVYTVHSEQLAVNPVYVPGSHRGYDCSVCKSRVPKDAVHGHLDAIVTDPRGLDFVLEHKSASRFSFQRWASGHEVPWDYITQTALYVVGARQIGADVQRQGIVLIKNKDTATYVELIVRAPTCVGEGEQPTVVESAIVMEGETAVEIDIPDEIRSRPRLLGDAVKRMAYVVRHADAKSLPDRPFPIDDWRCEWCQFSAECWRGYADASKAAASNKPIPLSGEDADLAQACAAAGANATQAKKVADKLKKQLKVRLIALGARSAFVASDDLGVDVNLDWRSRKTLDPDLIPPAVKAQAAKVREFEVLTVRAKKKPKQ